jgi:hypothetical protein
VDVSITTGDPGVISVSGEVDETMMFGSALRLKSTVETAAGSNRIRITDEITNFGGGPRELELLYHINTGRPFLEPGAKFIAPINEVTPRDPAAAAGIDTFDTFAAPLAGFAEQVYYFDLATDNIGWTKVLLQNAHGDKGLSISYDKRQLPCFALWKNTAAEEDGYVSGIEPATNFPNLKDFERKHGRVITLPAGGKHTARLDMEVHSTQLDVRTAELQIKGLQHGHELRVNRQPLAKWSPVE